MQTIKVYSFTASGKLSTESNENDLNMISTLVKELFKSVTTSIKVQTFASWMRCSIQIKPRPLPQYGSLDGCDSEKSGLIRHADARHSVYE